MYIIIVCFPGGDAINFEITLIFLIKPFFCMTKNSGQKFKYLENEKSFSEKKKVFIIFIGILLKQIKLFFLESESLNLKNLI